MGANRFYVLTSVAILLWLGYLTYQILQPFFNALAWAIVFTIVFYPVYSFIVRHVKSRFISSLLTIVLILVVVFGPFMSLSFVLMDELRNIAGSLDNEAVESIKNVLEAPQVARLTRKIQSYFGMEGIAGSDIIVGNIKKFGEGLLGDLSAWAANITRVVIDFVFMAFSIFFLLMDGPDFLRKARKYLPFSEEQEYRLAVQVKDMIVSTVYGGVLVALVQGLLGGIAFFALDIRSPVLWGSAMAIMSFLPMIGTFIIWGPAGIYLILHGSFIKGIALLLFGSLVIGIADNILRPVIISGRTKMPTLLIFFSVLGGINFFGFIGFIMGPLVLAMFVSVFSIFRNIEGGKDA